VTSPPAVALVTGAGRGIGRAIALRLAADGVAVGVTDLDGGSAAAVAAEVGAAGGRAAGLAADVTDLDAMRAAVRTVEDALGPLAILVNNAGWDHLRPFAESDPALWDRLIAVNLKGVLNATRAALDGMIARGRGRIVTVASDAGRVGSTGESVYSACKAGVIGFSKALAREVARHAITVNVVCPGPANTTLLRELMAGERGASILEGLRRAIPMRRLAEPEDVAGAVAYFASEAAAYVTGQVLSVSGGLTMVG
jgi:2-hydroxycyclohexanecarboxyl-CoA dehydrogenase